MRIKYLLHDVLFCLARQAVLSNHPVPGSPKKVAIFSLREIGADQTSVLSTRCKYLVGEIERVLRRRAQQARAALIRAL